MTNTLGEAAVFFGAIYGGIVIGMVYDVFRLMRLPFSGGRIANAVLDILFYAAAGALAAVTLLVINGGVPRLYAFAGIGLGVAGYLASVSALITQLARKCFPNVNTGRFGRKISKKHL